jgi:nucleotide-binding universal stress UspA family protein
MTESVLVFGDDGSAGADEAWGWIAAQPWSGWRAEVLTAVEPPLGPPPAPEAVAPHPWEPPSPRQAPESAGFSEIVHLRADAEPRYALSGRTDAALLVVGPAGGGILKSLHLGSTTEYLLHHPPTPVVIGRGAEKVRRALVGLDGSAHAERAVAALAALPWCSELEEVVVCTVADEASVGAASRGQACSLLERAGVDKVVERLVAGTHHADALLDLARERAVGLVVAGTHGRASVRDALLGSTAGALVHHATCAVLLAHEAGTDSG